MIDTMLEQSNVFARGNIRGNMYRIFNFIAQGVKIK